MKHKGFLPFLILTIGLFKPIFADNFEKGLNAFIYNKPQEAVGFLEKAVQEDLNNVEAYVYLSVAYEQLAKYEKAEITLQTAYERGLGKSGQLQYNLGNVLSRIKSFDRAINAYTQAIQIVPNYSKAFLGRGNNYLKIAKYALARADYVRFIEIAPEHPEVPAVRKMIAAIDEEVKFQEDQRLAEEQRKLEEERRRLAKEEQERIAAEKQKAEEERRKALLDKILSGMEDASGEAFGVDGGTEGIDDSENDFGREN